VARAAWRVFITAMHFNQNLENWVNNMCRLTARDVLLGGSSLKNLETTQKALVAWRL